MKSVDCLDKLEESTEQYTPIYPYNIMVIIVTD